MNAQTTAALEQLRAALEAAPKSSAGFVNWKRSSRLQREATAVIVASGVSQEDAKQMTLNIAKPFDCHYSKL